MNVQQQIPMYVTLHEVIVSTSHLVTSVPVKVITGGAGKTLNALVSMLCIT